MNKMQLLEQLRHFFWSMRRWWTWVLLSVSIICGGAASLVVMENKDSLWFAIVLYLVLGASLFTLLWLSSFFFVNWISKALNNHYAAATPNAAKQADDMHLSFSRLLSSKQRLQSYADLKELRDATDRCFLGGSSSYLRIQWLNPHLRTFDEPKEMVLPWPEDNQLFIDFTYEDENVFLLVSRKYNETGELAWMELFPEGAASKEEALDSVRLLLDEPCLLAYETLDEQPDGTSVPHKEALCAVTWIGGNH